MHRFKDLKVWQKAMELAKGVYEITAAFPKEEKYGLTSQINRSVVSVPSNIAEGAGRNSNKEFVHFLSIASGSLCELETQLILSAAFKYFENKKVEELSERIKELQNMIFKLQESLKS
jgi:four helix bundle protein